MMRKNLLLVLIGSLYSFSLFGQSDEVVITWPMVVAEAKKTDANIIHAKKATRSRTWTERGRKYLEVYAFDLKGAFPGMNVEDVIHVMKTNAKSKTTKGDTLVYSFDRINLHFLNSKLISYVRTDAAVEMFPNQTTPLEIAVEAYNKAREVDDGKRYELIGNQLQTIVSLYTNEGYYYILQDNYKKAEPYFSKIADILIQGYDSNPDSTRGSLLNDCGIIAYMAQEYDKSIQYYNKAIEKGYENIAVYGAIMNSQKNSNDTAAAIKTIQTIIEKYPTDSSTVEYIKELVNLYLGLKQYDEALEYLNKALEKEPNNTNFLLNIAILHETSGKTETAIEYYNKTLEIEPKNLGANANLGLLYVSQAREVLLEAGAAYGTKNYKQLNEKGQNLLKKAIPHYEAYASAETNPILLTNAYTDLMSIYSQLRKDAEYERVKKLRDNLN
ncbi:MAG: tetratricopeptide repeat protein [Bacteroidales bacterium]|nr:tetratricopeptide repeat protein [Bacteroidales bacterium]